MDDYGRHWSGNDLKSEDLLLTQCYNASQVHFLAALMLHLLGVVDPLYITFTYSAARAFADLDGFACVRRVHAP